MSRLMSVVRLPVISSGLVEVDLEVPAPDTAVSYDGGAA